MSYDVSLNEIVESIADTVTEEVEEYNADVSDSIHEHVDSSCWVIYYARAKYVVDQLCDSELEEAEDFLQDIGFEYNGLHDLYVKLAYGALVRLVEREM